MKKIKLNNKKYIGEQITQEDISEWGKNIVTIKAGTGAGKSVFIKDNLYNYAKTNGKKILLLVHRNNCRDQFKMDIVGKEDVIELTTYQSIDTFFTNNNPFHFAQYDYIVCDEFHYFTSDASFNNTTDMSIEHILNSDSTRIFMSATADLMHRYLNGHKKYKSIDYYMDMDFSFIDELWFYEDLDTENSIIEDIVEANEKVIVFANDLKRLEQIYKENKNISLFNCSEKAKEYKYVDKDKIQRMLKNERFEENILLATSVMDTGVSIKDEQVKHIICNNMLDVNVLIQCLGRKRILHKDDKVKVYIRDINNNKIGGHISDTNNKLEKVNYLKNNGKHQYIQKYKKKPENKEIIYPDMENGEDVLKINDMAYFKTLMDSVQLKAIANVDYKKYISDILGIKYKEKEVIIQNQKLEDFLDSIVGIKMYKEEQKILKSKFKDNGLNSRTVGFNTINGNIRDRGLSYILTKGKRGKYKDDNGQWKNEKSHWILEEIV